MAADEDHLIAVGRNGWRDGREARRTPSHPAGPLLNSLTSCDILKRICAEYGGARSFCRPHWRRVYPRTPHGPQEPKFVLGIMHRHLDWVAKHLGE